MQTVTRCWARAGLRDRLRRGRGSRWPVGHSSATPQTPPRIPFSWAERASLQKDPPGALEGSRAGGRLQRCQPGPAHIPQPQPELQGSLSVALHSPAPPPPNPRPIPPPQPSRLRVCWVY